MTVPIEISADYYGRYVTATRGETGACGTTMDRAEVEQALRNIAKGRYDVLDCGPIVLDEADLVEMRNRLDARAVKLADLKADATRGEA